AAISDAALAAAGVRTRPRVRIADSGALVAAVAAGAGVAIVSALVAGPAVHARRVVRVAIHGVSMRRPFSVVHRPGRTLSTLDRALLRAVGGAGGA
ncbi:MAG: hypothetical protein KGN74_07635, partial [Gemmatimonadota bacterium]|nr:hypothetical protein [Gemmatimonadota bacterium]